MENGITIEEVAKKLEVSTKSVRNYIKKGILSAKLEKGKLYVSSDSLRTFPSKKAGKVEVAKGSLSKVTIELSYLEGLLTRNAQLEAREQAVIDYKSALEFSQKRVADLEEELQKERSRGFWSRLFRR